MFTKPAAGVIATKPTTAPMQAPMAVIFLPTSASNITQVISAEAAAILVVPKAITASPLDESAESYLVQILNGSTVVRTLTVTSAQTWVYPDATITADGFIAGQTITFTVAQNSDQGVLGHGATASIQR